MDLFVSILNSSPAGKDDQGLINVIRGLLQQIPSVNSHVFENFIKFLFIVQANSHLNKMTSENLAIVFGGGTRPHNFRNGADFR